MSIGADLAWAVMYILQTHNSKEFRGFT